MYVTFGALISTVLPFGWVSVKLGPAPDLKNDTVIEPIAESTNILSLTVAPAVMVADGVAWTTVLTP